VVGKAVALTGRVTARSGGELRCVLAATLAAVLPFQAHGKTIQPPAAAAPADRLVASGGCRDGQPNGTYELRSADGRMRVVGAFAKGRRTGTFLFWTSAGDRVALIPYDHDTKTGTVALWHEAGLQRGEPRRRLESAYSEGVRNGATRSWYANGKPRAEYRYERGELAAAEAWSESGAPLPESAARRMAEQDRATDAEVYAAYEHTIAQHLPHCR
jgi:hypothetical protein